jgi:hypothetical protein
MAFPINRLHLALASSMAAIVLIALMGAATAQVTSEQQSAIRSSCRSDFMSKCSGVTPGGKDALACLQKNVAGLSPACKTAVSATIPAPAKSEAPPPPTPAKAAATPPPAPAAAPSAPDSAPPPAATTKTAPVVSAPAPKATMAPPPPRPAQPTAAQQNALRSSCQSDFMAHCSGVTPGGKDALACLQKNVASVSPACRNAVAAIGSPRPPAAMKPAAAAPALAPAAVAPVDAIPAGPTPQQLSAVKLTCRRDFSLHCKGVQPGGPEALACLQRNGPRLTPDCKTSLADIGDAMPVAAPAAATPPPASGMPNAPIAMTAVIGRACMRDLILHCRGVGVGEGQKIACLVARGSKLAPLCKVALKITEPVR